MLEYIELLLVNQRMKQQPSKYSFASLNGLLLETFSVHVVVVASFAQNEIIIKSGHTDRYVRRVPNKET